MLTVCPALHGGGSMKVNLVLTDGQKEEITVKFLEQLHSDLSSELRAHDLDPYLDQRDLIDVTRSAVAIEIIMKDLLFEEDYLKWKVRHGIEMAI